MVKGRPVTGHGAMVTVRVPVELEYVAVVYLAAAFGPSVVGTDVAVTMMVDAGVPGAAV